MLRNRLALAGALLNAAGLACLIVAWMRWDDIRIEGAYMNRSEDAGNGAFVVTGPDLDVWFLAAGVLLLGGTAALLLAARRGR